MQQIPTIDAAGLRERLRQGAEHPRLIDVRSEAEFNQGVIDGAECVPLHLVPLRAAEWIADGLPIIFYCRSGARSAQATIYLKQQAPELEVYNLAGGIIGWVQAGGTLTETRRRA